MISLTEYARRRGVDIKTVTEAVNRGRITTAPGKGNTKLVDPVVADKEWAENTDVSKVPAPEVPERITKKFNEARTEREAYKAKIAKLEYEEKKGKLVDAAQVKKQAFDEARRIRDGILGVPARISADLFALEKQFDIEQALLKELTAVLDRLSQGAK